MNTLFAVLGAGLAVLGKAMIFKKMDVEMWKALIPVYSEYLLFKKVWNTVMFKGWLLCAILAGVLSLMGSHMAAGTMEFLVSNVSNLLSLVSFGFVVVLCNKLAKSFGHGFGYTAGLLFLSPLFLNILGFENSEFQAA